MHPKSSLLLKLTRLAAPLLLALLALITALLGLSPQAVTPAQAAPPARPLHTDLFVACDTADLIAKINAANNETANPGPDTLILGAGCVYTLSGSILTMDGQPEITSTFGKAGLPAITSTIIISGNGATLQRALTATQDFAESFRLLTVGQTGDLTLYDLTLKNGLAMGGSGYSGGGGAAGMGGAIFNNRGRLALERVTLAGNQAQGGNGVSFIGGGGGGGGIGANADNSGGGGPNSGFGYNSGDFGGGGGGDGSGGFGGGGGGDGGGGDGGFGGGGGSGGGSGFGGGGFGVLVAGSGGFGGGGAVFNLTGTLWISNSTFYNNTAQGGGGIPGNSEGGVGMGGALFNLNGPAVIINSTFAGNMVAAGGGDPNTKYVSAGGGLYSLGDGGLDSSAVTGINDLVAPASLVISNTIIANSAGGITDCVVSIHPDPFHGGTSTVIGTNNLVELNQGCAGVTQTADPNLGPLQDNGGASWTMALLTGSPALDAGDNNAASGLTTDQRGPGFLRITNGTVDIGAFESQPVLVVAKTIITDPVVAGTGSVYTITIVNQGVVTAQNVTLSDTLSLSTTLLAVDQTDGDGADFNLGTHNNTHWYEYNHNEWLEMVNPGLGSGQFTSRVMDAGYEGAWTELAWRPARPYGKALPDNRAEETFYPLGNVNMTGNRALLHMDGNLNDSSGQGLNGDCTHCPTTGAAGRFGNAATFNGSSDEVMISDTVDPARYALELWVYPTQIPITTSLIVRTDALSGTTYNYSHLLGIQGNHFVHLLDDGSRQEVVGKTPVLPNTWYHLVGTAESGGDMKLYVNGVEDGRREHLGVLWTGGDEYRLGAAYGQTSAITTTHFAGRLDEVAVYTRTLAADEVMNHYLRDALRLSFEVRSCALSGCGDNPPWSGPYTDQSDPLTRYYTATFTLTNNRYFQYRATFESEAARYSPQVSWVQAQPDHWLVTASQGSCDRSRQAFSCGLNDIAPGATVTVTVPAYIDPSALGLITNTVQVTSTNAVTRTAAATVTVVSHSDLQVEKFDEWELGNHVYDFDPVNPGKPISYSLQIYNNGPSTAWDVTFTDTMPVAITGLITPDGWTCDPLVGQVLTCTTASLRPNWTYNFTVGGLAPGLEGVITNTLSITASGSTVMSTTRLITTAQTTVRYLADLAIDKIANPDPIEPATNFTYIITVTNNGPYTAIGIVVTDTLPFGVTGSGTGCSTGAQVVCTLSTLAPDLSYNFNITVTNPLTNGMLFNHAWVSSNIYDPEPDNNDVYLYTAIRRVTDLSVSKTDQPDPVYTGAALTYTLTVTNSGPVAAGALTTTVTVTNPRSLSFVLGNNRARPYSRDIWLNGINGVIRNITVTVSNINHTYPADMVLLLVGPDGQNATILMANAGGGTDFNGTLSFNDNAAANLPLSDTITAGVYKPTNHGFSGNLPEPVSAGPYGGSLSDFNGSNPNGWWELYADDTFPSSDVGVIGGWSLQLVAVTTDTVTLTDTLPISLTDVSVNNPAGWSCGSFGNQVTCEVEYLGVNQPATFMVNATAPAVGGVITNTASVTATTYDPNLITNTATITTLVLSGADLGIAKTVNTTAPQPGSLLTYTLVVTNSGPGDATGVVVSDTLPVSVTLVTSQTSQGQYNPAAGLWTVGVISNGQRVTATLVVTVNAATGQILTNTAVISTLNQSDSITANDRAQAVVTVGSGADLGLIKTAIAPARAPGSTITYTIVVSNAGPNPTTGVVISDTLPGQVTFAASTTTKGVYEQTGGLWLVGDMALNEFVTMTLVVTINLNASGNIVNTAVISATTATDPQPGNQSSTATVTVSGGGGDIYLPIIFKNFGPFIQPQ